MTSTEFTDAQSWVGLPASTAYTRLLLSDPRVQRFSVFKYRTPPTLQQRIQMTEADKAIMEHALELRRTAHLPFWNAMFASCLIRGTYSDELVMAAFFHNGPGESVEYARSDLEGGVLNELAETGGGNVGLSSAVRDANLQVWHLALLDFRCDISPKNEALAALVCSHLMPQGYLLIDSGDSYHACGLTLLSAEERVHMLGKALLAAPIVDSHYIAHQLQQPESTIRISRRGKTSRGPRVVRVSLQQAEAP
jgi:hypothetical protein